MGFNTKKSESINLDENWKENQVVIEMVSTSLTECQARYSPVEKERLAAVTAITKLDFIAEQLLKYMYIVTVPHW